MKLTYHWLKDYVPINISPKDLAHKLTMAGLEVRGIESTGGDTVFELEITPNRPDCLNLLGIAREASAILNTPLKIPTVKPLKTTKTKTDITIHDKEGCPRYIGAVIRNVSVRNSPEGIKNYLAAVGTRSVNNIVDITNFCLMETGQPLHAFDYDKLIGGKIIVRRAKDGETMTTIDGSERKLNSSILVIADARRPVAIAGVMGGKETEVTTQTKNILLESAYFNPILIRRGARSLGLSSDSSYRFERGVDIESVKTGLERAAALILKEAGGALFSFSDLYPKKSATAKRTITVLKNNIDTALGTAVSPVRLKTLFQKLGFKIAGNGRTLKISVPSFRADVKEEVDIIEEAARLVGYTEIPTNLPEIKASFIPQSRERALREKVKRLLATQGLSETIGYSMASREDLKKCGLAESDTLSVQNPLTADEDIMRPSLLPSLLSAVLLNLNRGQKDLALFETGKTYASSHPSEKEALGIILTGKRSYDWRGASPEADFYDLKGMIEETFSRLGAGVPKFVPGIKPYLENDTNADIYLGKEKIGTLGQISGEVLRRWDIKPKNIFFAEIGLAALYQNAKLQRNFTLPSGYPAVVRDISLAVKKGVSFDEVCGIARETASRFLTDIKFVEQYAGEKIPKGYLGITLSLVYQSPSRTLREEEVANLHEAFARTVVERLGAIRR